MSKAELKKKNSQRLREAGLVRLYVPGASDRFMIVPKGEVPPGARRISDTEYTIA